MGFPVVCVDHLAAHYLDFRFAGGTESDILLREALLLMHDGSLRLLELHCLLGADCRNRLRVLFFTMDRRGA